MSKPTLFQEASKGDGMFNPTDRNVFPHVITDKRWHIFDPADAGLFLRINALGTELEFASASGGTVLGSGTLNRVAKWTPNGTTIGDSSIFDDGTKVYVDSGVNTGFGTTTPSTAVHIVGVGQGFRYQDGFEGAGKLLMSDANGDATWQTVSLTTSLANLTDVSLGPLNTGDILYYDGSNWTNRSNDENVWLVNGNTLGNDTSWIGSIDNFDYSIRTNSIERLRVLKTGEVGIGGSAVTGNRLVIKGATNTSAEYGLRVVNSDNTDILQIRNDRRVSFGNSGFINGYTFAGFDTTFTGTVSVGGSFVTSHQFEVRGSDNTNILFVKTSDAVNKASMGSIGGHGWIAVFDSGGSYSGAFTGNPTGDSWLSSALGIGISPFTALTSKFQIKGSGSTSATYSLKIQNSASALNFSIQDDGAVYSKLGYWIDPDTTGTPTRFISNMNGNTTDIVIGINTNLHALANTIGQVTVVGSQCGGAFVGTSSNSLTILGYNNYNNLVNGSGNIAIGSGHSFSASGTYNHSIAIGSDVSMTASNQMVVGSAFAGIDNVYFGKGVANPDANLFVGAIAVNTTSPTAKLHVVSTQQYASTFSANFPTVSNVNGTTFDFISTSSDNAVNGTNLTGLNLNHSYTGTGAGVGGNFNIYGIGSTVSAPNLTAGQSSNVISYYANSTQANIGTNVGLWLEVQGASSENRGIYMRSDQTTGATYGFYFFPYGTQSSSSYFLYNVGTTQSYHGGRFGIGAIAAVDTMLHVQGSGATSATTSMHIENSSGRWMIDVSDGPSTGIRFGNALQGDTRVHADVGAGGTLEVGSPTVVNAKLAIYQSAGYGMYGMYLDGGDPTGTSINLAYMRARSAAGASVDGLTIEALASGGGGSNSTTALRLSASGADANYAMLISSGIVGIGTTTPTATNHVSLVGTADWFNGINISGGYAAGGSSINIVTPTTSTYAGITIANASTNADGISITCTGGNLNQALLLSASGGSTSNYALKTLLGDVNMASLPTGNAGLASGDLYVDTAANILANGDLVVGRKV
jgi:hypothetical protein